MPRFTAIPSRNGLASTELYTRISTPQSHDAEHINPAFETVVFIHPLWTDSFFFYPQYEEPVFAEHFNLVAFDARGHGMTTGDLNEGCTYSWKDVAIDIREALRALRITKAHFIGVGSSTTAAAYLASLFPKTALTTSLIAPTPRIETPASAQVYDELLQTLDTAVRNRDAESLEHIVVSMFDFHLDYQQAPQLRGVRDEYVLMAKGSLATEQLYSAAQYIRSLIQSRHLTPSEVEMKSIQGPLLIMSETPRKTAERDEYENLVFTINANHPASRPHAIQQYIEGPKWLTLASPNLVNPVLSSFLSTPPNQSLTPLPTPGLRSPRPTSRRPSTPREFTSFSIPPVPLAKTGVMTIGEALDQEARRRNAEESLHKSPSVVNMTVEVIVTVDPATEASSD